MSTVNATEVKSFDLSISDFQAAISINSIIMAGFLGAFLLLRSFLPFVYSPKKGTKVFAKEAIKSVHKSLLSFLPEMFNVSDDEIVDVAGINGFSVFAFCRLMFKIFLGVGFLCLVVLLPINITGTVNKTGLDQFTMGNVSDEGRFTGHLVMSWVCNVLIIYGVFKMLNLAVKIRRDHLMNVLENSLGHRTVLVRDIPPELLDEQTLFDLFDDVGPVDRVILVKQHHNLSNLVMKAEKLRADLEVSAMLYLRNALKESSKFERKRTVSTVDIDAIDSKRPTRSVGLFSRKKTDRIKNTLAKYGEVKTSLELAKPEAESKAPEFCAFVVFKKESTANLALSASMIDNPLGMAERHLIIDADNIRWQALGFPYTYRLLMYVAGNSAVIAMSIFWFAIVAFVSTWASLDTLSRYIPFLIDLIRAYPALGSFISGFVVPFLVSFLLSLVPTILRMIAGYQGAATIAAVEKFVLSWQYFFLVFNVLIVVTVSSSVIESIGGIIKDPLSAPNLFAQAVPPASKYFINYVMLLGFSGPPGALLQISQIIMRSIGVFGLLGTNTPRTLLGALQPAQWDFPAQMAQHSLVVTIGITYATLAPMVLIFVNFYFGFWSFAYLYLVQNVYDKGIQTGGTELYHSSTQIFVGVYISQITLAGLFSAQKAFIHFVFVLIQIGVTVIAQVYTSKYKKIILELPVKVAQENARKESEKRKLKRESANTSTETLDANSPEKPKGKHTFGGIVGGLFKDVSGIAQDVGKLGKGVTTQLAGVGEGLASATGVDKVIKGVGEGIATVTGTDIMKSMTLSRTQSPTPESGINPTTVSSSSVEEEILSIHENDYEMLIHPAIRKDALKKVWLPMNDPLNFVEDIIAPEYFNAGIAIEPVEATVDWKGRLELGNGMLELQSAV